MTADFFGVSLLAVNNFPLFNQVGGQIVVESGVAGGSRVLTAELVNRGTIDVQHPLLLRAQGDEFVNSDLIDVSGGGLAIELPADADFNNSGTINVIGGDMSASMSRFTNSGIVHIDDEHGITDVPGSYMQTADGRLELDVASLAQFGRAGFGRVDLDGTLAVQLVEGFSPMVGDAFQVLTYTSRVDEADAFALIEGAPVIYDAVYATDSLTLTVVAVNGAEATASDNNGLASILLTPRDSIPLLAIDSGPRLNLARSLARARRPEPIHGALPMHAFDNAFAQFSDHRTGSSSSDRFAILPLKRWSKLNEVSGLRDAVFAELDNCFAPRSTLPPC